MNITKIMAQSNCKEQTKLENESRDETKMDQNMIARHKG